MDRSRNRNQQPNDDKLRELILFIALHSEGDEAFGATKLNKLLFYSDFSAYLRFGKAITGQEYQALHQGPAPRRLVPIRDQLEQKSEIAIRKKDYYGGWQDRILALREANLERFSANEIALVDRLIHQWWGMSGRQMSSQAHKFVGCLLAEVGETIPYSAALDRRHRGASLF